jgi:hypothetical protein
VIKTLPKKMGIISLCVPFQQKTLKHINDKSLVLIIIKLNQWNKIFKHSKQCNIQSSWNNVKVIESLECTPF